MRDASRNVHAYLQGELVRRSAKRPRAGTGWRKITYNCRKRGAQPYFYDVHTGEIFEGAVEVRLVPKRAGGVEVWVRGDPARENPPSCGCRNRGGLCTCGVVESEEPKEENPPVRPCGSPVAAEGLGVHLIQRRPRACVVLLDLDNVRAYGPDDLEAFGTCPLLAGWGVVRGPRIARPGLDGRLDGELDWLGPHQHSPELVALAQRSGLDLLALEDLLCREGDAWWRSGR